MLSACADTAGDGGGGVVRDSAGIVIVENDAARPVWDDDEAWRLSTDPVVRIGTVHDDPTQQLFRVIDSGRLIDGRIAVVNNGSSQVRLYSPDGRYLDAIGGDGDGPGEFRSPWAVHEIPGDSILVVDLYRHVSVFDREGRFARRFLPARPDEVVGGEGFEPVGSFGDGTLLFRSHYRSSSPATGLYRNRIAMVRTLLDGASSGSLGDFDDQTMLAGSQGMYMYGPWAQEAPADSTMWYGPGDRLELRELAFDGSVIRIIRMERPARAVSEADMASYRTYVGEQYRGTPREQAGNRLAESTQFAPVFPAHFELRVDGAGNLWVQDYQPFHERVPRVWSVFDSGGRYFGDVTVPAGLRVHEIGADYILGLTRDELDVEYVVMHRLEKPGS